LPLITAPLAVISLGSFFVQGLLGSGRRRVAKIFTTEFSTAFEGVAVGDKTTTGEGFASGVGVTGGGLCSTGAARIDATAKISEAAKAHVMAKTSRELWWIIRQRNLIRERKRASFFWGSGERRQLAKHNIVGKLPTIAGWQPALPRERRFGNRRSLLFPPRQGKR
jgi:hypothetical protein